MSIFTSNIFKKIITISLPLFGILIQSSSLFAQIPASNMKWYPGHYIMNNIKDQQSKEQLLQDFKNIPSLRGIQLTYMWSSLESSKGVYDFSKIQADLNLASKYGKKLSIMIGYKYRVSATQSSLPQYVLNLPKVTVNTLTSVPPYFTQGKPGDGKYNVGHHANFGHPGTLAAFEKLLTALAKKFDGNPNFAFIQFIETSIGADPGPAQTENFLNGVMKMNVKAKEAFATTPIIQSLNFPRNKLSQFISNLTNHKMGFGGPDTFTGSFDFNEGLAFNSPTNPGIYHYNEANYDDLTDRNKLPIGMQAHTGSMLFLTRTHELEYQKGLRGVDFKTATEGVNAVYNFAINRLHSNYLIWQVFGPADENRIALKAKLIAIQSQNPSKSGGLPNKCPSIFDSCATLTTTP